MLLIAGVHIEVGVTGGMGLDERWEGNIAPVGLVGLAQFNTRKLNINKIIPATLKCADRRRSTGAFQ